MIVGAGSAGCVLAERLSASHSVVLLEAGGDDRSPEVVVPAAFSKLFKTERDWNFSSEPEPAADGRSLYLPRGKMVGGSSGMNAMLYVRGRPSDYDGWAEAGATGWDWDTVLPVFREMESNSRGEDDFHGDSGPVRVEDQRAPNPLSRRFVEAAIAAGIPPNRDFNGQDQEGVGFFQVTQRRGRRWSAADAYLKPALRRPTLELVTAAKASRLIIEKETARGVEYHSDGNVSRVEAEAGVILAAGSYGSPHLLQLSGVGDPDHLAGVGIPVVVSSPEVGENLQDHPIAGAMYESLLPGTLDDAENMVEMLRWLVLRRGRLTSPVAEAGAFVRSLPHMAEPDLQFYFGPVSFDNHGLEPFDGHAFTFGPLLLNPMSRGWVRARDDDPTSSPAIQVNCLTERHDLDALIRGMEIAADIAARGPLDPYRGRRIHPAPGVASQDELANFIRGKVELLYHPVGTCRMGSDDTAVVDPELRVNGVERLRVVDASVMPTITSGNTNAPTMMIAERAARMILGDPG